MLERDAVISSVVNGASEGAFGVWRSVVLFVMRVGIRLRQLCGVWDVWQLSLAVSCVVRGGVGRRIREGKLPRMPLFPDYVDRVSYGWALVLLMVVRYRLG